MTNSKIIDSSNNWNLLLYKEALHIKIRKSILNNGLKASRDLQLFNYAHFIWNYFSLIFAETISR